MFMVHVHVHDSCPCPCCMSISMLHVHVHGVCPCPCCVSICMLHAHVLVCAGCPCLCPVCWSVYILNVYFHYTCPCLCQCPCYMSMSMACPSPICKSMFIKYVHVNAASPCQCSFCIACPCSGCILISMSMPLGCCVRMCMHVYKCGLSGIRSVLYWNEKNWWCRDRSGIRPSPRSPEFFWSHTWLKLWMPALVSSMPMPRYGTGTHLW
jgi:hypothetical protein